MSFLVCTHCKSFVPQSLSVCPNCDTTVSKPKSPLMRKVINVAAAASISVTLSACYGPPCSPGFEQECTIMLDQTLPLADQTLPLADQGEIPIFDQAVPALDDQALPVVDQGLTPILDQALPAVDQSMGK